MTGRPFLMLALLAAFGVGLSACGRKADLDTPYQAQMDARKQAQKEKQEPLPPEPTPPVKDRPFILDRLL